MLRKPLFQDRALSLLEDCFKKEKVLNSLLLTGNEGVGKTTMAIYLASSLYCTDNKKPCMHCENCQRIMNFSHPSVILINTDDTSEKLLSISRIIKKNNVNPEILKELSYILRDILFRISNNYLSNTGEKNKKKKQEIEKAIENLIPFLNLNDNDKKNEYSKAIDNGLLLSDAINIKNIPVESIRELLNRVYKSSFGGGITVIITGIEKMRKEGANAFLKTLEEPPGNTKFFLCTKDENLILQTIKSRCFKISLNTLSDDNIKQIAYSNWNINSNIVSENGGILTRIAGENNFYINILFSDVMPSFESKIFAFIDKIIIDDKFLDFFFQLSSVFSYSNNNISVKLNKIPFNIRISLQKDINKMISYSKSNNLDKKMILEVILMKIHSLWRQLSI